MDKRIATIDFPLKSDLVENLKFRNPKSLSDFDIIILNPSFQSFHTAVLNNVNELEISIRKTLFNSLTKLIRDWQIELLYALDLNKSVFIILSSFVHVQSLNYEFTNNEHFNYNLFFNNHENLKFNFKLKNSSGSKLYCLNKNFDNLCILFNNILNQELIIEHNDNINFKNIFISKDNKKVLGIQVCSNNYSGNLFFIPNIHFSPKYYDSNSKRFTKEGELLSDNIAIEIINIHDFYSNQIIQTPPPAWIDNHKSNIPKLNKLNEVISNLNDEKLKIEKSIESTQKEINNFDFISHLYYENGKTLEIAVEKTLKLLGFEVSNYNNNDSEIDHYIKSPDTENEIYIGESEGKDNATIDKKKLAQLVTHLTEQIQIKEESIEFNGLLFGNPFRLLNPDERTEPFSNHCISFAKKFYIGLITTPSLVPIASYLMEYSNDEDFKKSCRDAIKNQLGGIIKFPEIPKS